MPHLWVIMSLLTPANKRVPLRPAYTVPASAPVRWWRTYRRLMLFCVVTYGCAALPLGIELLVDPAGGLVNLLHVGLAVGFMTVTLGPVVWWMNKRKPDEY